MSYPAPPGLKPTTSQAPTHPSLPARPPPSAFPPASFKPAFAPTTVYNNAGRGSSYGASSFQSFQPRALSTPAAAAPPAGFSQYNAQPYQQPGAYGYDAPPDQGYSVPQIRNPFAPPSATGAGRGGAYEHDPELEAQIAQWQSAYVAKDNNDKSSGGGGGGFRRFGGAGGGEGSGAATSANAAPLGGRTDTHALNSHAVSSAVHADSGVATVVPGADGKQATVVRSGGGKQWTDESLLEWDPSHFRIFVGNLAGEVTDESLLKAFSRWPSVQKARVVRDKRTTKSKGFGFVSFSDGDEFFQAAREMQGKYIGSHPVLIKRSTTEIKAVVPNDRNKGKHGKHGKGNGGGNGGGGGGGAGGHANTGAGVHKAGQKTKGGLRVLG